MTEWILNNMNFVLDIQAATACVIVVIIEVIADATECFMCKWN